jgi:hypothetical protein
MPGFSLGSLPAVQTPKRDPLMRLIDRAWDRLREMMAAGKLTGYLFRASDGRTEPADPNYWHSRSVSSEAHLTGECDVYVSGAKLKARVRIKRADLQLVLAGRSAALPLKAYARRGRKPKQGFDKLWVELCLVFHLGEVKRDRVSLKKHMAQWAINHNLEYEEDTIDDKVALLLREFAARKNSRASK